MLDTWKKKKKERKPEYCAYLPHPDDVDPLVLGGITLNSFMSSTEMQAW